MRITILGQNSKRFFSGGRLYAWFLAEAAAFMGHEVTYITNNRPAFYNDFSNFPAHNKIRIITKPLMDDLWDMPTIESDILLVVPHGTWTPIFYLKARQFAYENKIPLILLNFESGNWFNELSHTKRDLSDWDGWRFCVQGASAVVSISKEGKKYAEEFYHSSNPDALHLYCYPCINDIIADSVVRRKTMKRILVITRFSQSDHKGGERIPDLLCDTMKGYTVSIIVGSGGIPEKILKTIRERAKRFGIKIEILTQLTEKEKFEELKKSALLLFPSLFEGFGMPPVEAQYCGLPCIAFDLPVLREVNGDGIHYVPREDVVAFRKKITQVLAQPFSESTPSDQVKEIAKFTNLGTRFERILLETIERGRTPGDWQVALQYPENYRWGISECTHDHLNNRLRVRGYSLGLTLKRVDILLEGNSLVGSAKINQHRTDLAKQFPEYENPNCGWVFESQVLERIDADSSIVVRAFYEEPYVKEAKLQVKWPTIEQRSLKIDGEASWSNPTTEFVERLINEYESLEMKSLTPLPKLIANGENKSLRTIVVSGYFSGSDAKRKLDYFNRLDGVLRKKGYRILVVNFTTKRADAKCDIHYCPDYTTNIYNVHRSPMRELHGRDFLRLEDMPPELLRAAIVEADTRQVPVTGTALKTIYLCSYLKKIFEKEDPALWIVWHQFNGYSYTIVPMCRMFGVPYLYAEYGVLPGTINFDREGQMAESSVATDHKSFIKLPFDLPDLETSDRFLEHVRLQKKTRKDQGSAVDVGEIVEGARRKGRMIVFYAGQNDWASGILPYQWLPTPKIHSPFYRDTLDALNHLSVLAEKNDWHVLFKPHPQVEKRHEDYQCEFPERISSVIGANIFDCMEMTDVTVTILSQVSYLALIHNRPCVMLGRNQLRGKGCVYQPESLEKVGETIILALKQGFTKEMRKKWRQHVTQLTIHYVFSMDSDVEAIIGRGLESSSDYIIEQSMRRPEKTDFSPAYMDPPFKEKLFSSMRVAARRMPQPIYKAILYTYQGVFKKGGSGSKS